MRTETSRAEQVGNVGVCISNTYWADAAGSSASGRVDCTVGWLAMSREGVNSSRVTARGRHVSAGGRLGRAEERERAEEERERREPYLRIRDAHIRIHISTCAVLAIQPEGKCKLQEGNHREKVLRILWRHHEDEEALL